MFCTIKFVYYKSFCVRDDIGSYIRTVYHMVSHTPKAGVGGSNPLWDTIKGAVKERLTNRATLAVANVALVLVGNSHFRFNSIPLPTGNRGYCGA